MTGVADRRKLSFAGHVSVSILLDERGDMMDDPEIVAIGTPQRTADGKNFEDMILDAVDSAISSIPAKRRRDLDMVQEAARRAVRSACERNWGRKPVATVFVIQV